MTPWASSTDYPAEEATEAEEAHFGTEPCETSRESLPLVKLFHELGVNMSTKLGRCSRTTIC